MEIIIIYVKMREKFASLLLMAPLTVEAARTIKMPLTLERVDDDLF